MIQNSFKTKSFFKVMLYFCHWGRQNLRQLKKTDLSFNTDTTGATTCAKSTDELTKKTAGKMTKVWKTWCKLSCGFLRPISKSFKSLERVFISAPKEKRLHFWGCLVRQHGGRWAYTWWENEKHIARSKTFQVLQKPFNQGYSCHNPWQARFWSKAYYGRKRT